MGFVGLVNDMSGGFPFPTSQLGRVRDQGYAITFATDVATMQSYFLILHAADIAGEPAATLRIPNRVPAGLHGCWVPRKLAYNVGNEF